MALNCCLASTRKVIAANGIEYAYRGRRCF